MALFELPADKARLRDVSQFAYGRVSGDPTHATNAQDAHWQAGYLLGCHTRKESADDIQDEWLARKKPGVWQTDPTGVEHKRAEAFRAWKAGYWAGRYTRL